MEDTKPKREPRLHELLAVEADLANTANKLLEEATGTLTKKPEHFRGHTKTATYFDESRFGENTTDTKPLTTTVGDKISYAFDAAAKLFDALLRKEEANQRASSDIILGDKVLAIGVPATFLLGMETRLKAIRGVIEGAPTLDPSLIWTPAPDQGAGVYRSSTKVTMRGEKALRFKVLYDATDKHPAQIEKWNEDVPVARIEEVQLSGMWTPLQKSEVLGRVDALIKAVKEARQRANTVTVAPLKIGGGLLDFILKG